MAFACGLASKPMLVTLPALLLIIDFWPLRRIAGWSEPAPSFSVEQVPLRRLVIEKLPLLLLSAASAVITVIAQRARGAVQTVADFSYIARFENAALSYGKYILKAFWPAHFAVYYPSPFDPTFVQGPGREVVIVSALSGVLILTIGFLAWKQRSRRPYLLAGWAWFFVALIPVIGIVQVGRQAMADRYAYVPMIGLFFAAVWGFGEIAGRVGMRDVPQRVVAVVALGTFLFLTWREVEHWSSSYELWTHALEVTTNNYLGESELGNVLVLDHRYEEALPHYQRAAALDAQDADSRVNIGTIDEVAGRFPEAAENYRQAIRILSAQPATTVQADTFFAANFSLGNTYVEMGEYGKAAESYRRARQASSDSFSAYIEKFKATLPNRPTAAGYVMLGMTLEVAGRAEEAFAAFQEAGILDPKLGAIFAKFNEGKEEERRP
jgi:tetratricopeptide (TPR) repeat protein